ncbi:MAG: patatin-like phospholipase family protein, partial [Micropepsaceae bacterium]
MNMRANTMNPSDLASAPAPQRPQSYDKKVALVLQGGGALGSYQAGVYEASTSKLWPNALMGPFADTQRAASSMTSMLYGTPGFFAPRPPMSWIGKTKPTSYYDTAPLKATLERLVDFDRINSKEMRFAVGAVNVR